MQLVVTKMTDCVVLQYVDVQQQENLMTELLLKSIETVQMGLVMRVVNCMVRV